MIRRNSRSSSPVRSTSPALLASLAIASLAFPPMAPAAGADAVPRVPVFLRGDANQDGKADLSDALSVLGCVFLGKTCSECRDAQDANDDGRVDISDAVSLLQWQFLGGAAPPAPGARRCGADPTPDQLRECVYDTQACPVGPLPPGTVPYVVEGVEPREVEPSQGPFALTITGHGFAAGVFVRAYYPDEGSLSIDLEPEFVDDDRVVVRIAPEWLKSLESAPVARLAGAPLPVEPADGFFVKIVHPDGASSEPGVVLIRRFALRVSVAGNEPLVLGKGNAVAVALEWRAWSEPVRVELAAFEAPPDPSGLTEPTAMLLRRIPGIQGAAVVEAALEQTAIPVGVAAGVAPGEYLVQVLVKSLSTAAMATPNRTLCVATARLAVVEAPATRTVLAKVKDPPAPGPSPPPVGPLLPPTCFGVDLQVVSESDDSVVLQWRYPEYATEHVLERMVHVPQPGKYDSEEVEWREIAAFDLTDLTDGWIQFTDTRDGLWWDLDCARCYRIRAWNSHGAGTSREACTVAGDPWIQWDDPPVLHRADVFDWGFQLEWSASLRADGTNTFSLHVSANDVGTSLKLLDSSSGSGVYVWNIAWSQLEYFFDNLDTSRMACVKVALQNRCRFVDFSNEICIQFPEPSSPSPPPGGAPPPPPSTPTADLGFWQGIYVCDQDMNGVQFVQPGQAIGVAWGPGNYGTADTGSFTDTLRLDGGNAWPFRLSSVGWPGWYDLEYRWYPHGFTAGTHDFDVQLDALNDVSPEIFEGNNQHSYHGFKVGH